MRGRDPVSFRKGCFHSGGAGLGDTSCGTSMEWPLVVFCSPSWSAGAESQGSGVVPGDQPWVGGSGQAS